jgi:DNA invertase Pin-like site-specific DNA recombinase
MIYLGYCRVSTEQQSLDMQLAALTPLCSEKIWREKKSGMTQIGRTELGALITEAQRLRSAGAEVCVVVYSLSRLGRRLVETVQLIESLRAAGIGFKSTSESIDTSTPMGRAFMKIIVTLAEAEAEILSERTKAGLATRKANGIRLGPPVKDKTEQVEQAKHLIAGGLSMRQAAKQAGLTYTTLLRRLKAA